MYLRINHPAESVGRDGKLLNTLRVRSRSEDARDRRNPAQRAKKKATPRSEPATDRRTEKEH